MERHCDDIVFFMPELRKELFILQLTSAIACLIVCQWLSNCYQDIRLFRFDDQTGDVYILAGDDMEIIVPFDGAWYFL